MISQLLQVYTQQHKTELYLYIVRAVLTPGFYLMIEEIKQLFNITNCKNSLSEQRFNKQ